MKAAVYKDKNITISEIERPVLDGKGAIIKVLGCGLCGSDIVKYQHGFKDGGVLGHEVVGEIIEINSDNKSFKIGDMVALGHHYPCYECVYCKNGHYSMCDMFKTSNIVPGGFAEYIKVSEGHLKYTVAKIPENLDLIEASFMEPVGCCHRAVAMSGVKEGDNVLIIGLGSIGILMGQVAKAYGAKVFGSDMKRERLETALEYGFDGVVEYIDNETSSKNYKEKALETGADKVFLTAGANSSLDYALSCVRNGGTICVFASIKSDEAGFANNQLYYRELKVMGVYSSSPKDLHASMKLIQQGKINVKGLSTVYIFDKINDAIEDTIQNKVLKAFIRISD